MKNGANIKFLWNMLTSRYCSICQICHVLLLNNTTHVQIRDSIPAQNKLPFSCDDCPKGCNQGTASRGSKNDLGYLSCAPPRCLKTPLRKE